MARKRRTTLSANQLVAHNLRRAREERQWTQEQAAEKLEPYLGARWSKASFSAAETSVTSGRVREFTANDLLAFATVFEQPLEFFFVPPDGIDNVTTGGSVSLEPAQVGRVMAAPDVRRLAQIGQMLDTAAHEYRRAVLGGGDRLTTALLAGPPRPKRTSGGGA
jgi:transcriptional regulator with XRE-family HTH domain